MKKLDYETPNIQITGFVMREDIMTASTGLVDGGGGGEIGGGGEGSIDISDLM